MAIFNQQPAAKKDAATRFTPDAAAVPRSAQPAAVGAGPSAPSAAPRRRAPQAKESLIASDLTIEGKIEGTGHVRIAGRFKGDVNVAGRPHDRGRRQAHRRRARQARRRSRGELEGNIDGAAARRTAREAACSSATSRPASLTVAAGSRMRGQADFGWDDKTRPRRSTAASTRHGIARRVMSTARPGTAGATRVCPHCKATILESASVCPPCRRHLRYDDGGDAARRRTRSRPCASKARCAAAEAIPRSNTRWCCRSATNAARKSTRQVIGVGALRAGRAAHLHPAGRDDRGHRRQGQRRRH